MRIVVRINARRLLESRVPATAAALTLLVLLTVAACSPRQQPSDEKKGEAISQVPPKLEPLPPPAAAVVARPPVASEGNCAPSYAKGGKGTCINNQPCRGFGVRAEDGKAVCTCFGRDGGCGEGQRCDAMKKACVPENEPVFGRSPAR